jgi:hypothetical protein
MQIEVRVARYRNGSGFVGMAEMVVAAARTGQFPTMVLQHPNNVSDLHRGIMKDV